MGDIWPYGPPQFIPWVEAYNYLIGTGQNTYIASTLAAIAQAESSLDLSVINDTPSTGDYSVGAWQINYYDGLYAGRAAAYGTPQQLIAGGLPAQVRAALGILSGQGFTAWSTYNNGSYAQYLHGAPQQPPQTAPGGQGNASIYVDPLPAPDSSDSWRDLTENTGDQFTNVSNALNAVGAHIDALLP